MKKVCINIDWFEVFAYEPPFFGAPEDYEKLGFRVAVRDYGTRVYKQMFTVIASGLPWLEVRRLPKSVASEGGILHDGACNIRLVNRSCYEPNAISILYKFLSELGYNYKNKSVCIVSRVDIAIDFKTFCHKRSVPAFLKQYLGGKYAKINQSRLCAWGTDYFSEKYYHACKWGSPSSMVSTKIYDKTKELAEERNKPWIRDAWVAAGLHHDTLDETNIWRLEFSLNSDCKFWITDVNHHDDYYLNNDIYMWCNEKRYIKIMAGLTSHYFKFVEVLPDKPKYKCPVVQLFDFDDCERYLPRPLRNLLESGRGEQAAINKIRKVIASNALSPRAKDVMTDAIEIFELIYGYRKLNGDKGIEKFVSDVTHRNDVERFAQMLADIEGDTSCELELRQAVSILREHFWGYFTRKITTPSKTAWEDTGQKIGRSV